MDGMITCPNCSTAFAPQTSALQSCPSCRAQLQISYGGDQQIAMSQFHHTSHTNQTSRGPGPEGEGFPYPFQHQQQLHQHQGASGQFPQNPPQYPQNAQQFPQNQQPAGYPHQQHFHQTQHVYPAGSGPVPGSGPAPGVVAYPYAQPMNPTIVVVHAPPQNRSAAADDQVTVPDATWHEASLVEARWFNAFLYFLALLAILALSLPAWTQAKDCTNTTDFGLRGATLNGIKVSYDECKSISRYCSSMHNAAKLALGFFVPATVAVALLAVGFTLHLMAILPGIVTPKGMGTVAVLGSFLGFVSPLIWGVNARSAKLLEEVPFCSSTSTSLQFPFFAAIIVVVGLAATESWTRRMHKLAREAVLASRP